MITQCTPTRYKIPHDLIFVGKMLVLALAQLATSRGGGSGGRVVVSCHPSLPALNVYAHVIVCASRSQSTLAPSPAGQPCLTRMAISLEAVLPLTRLASQGLAGRSNQLRRGGLGLGRACGLQSRAQVAQQKMLRQYVWTRPPVLSSRSMSVGTRCVQLYSGWMLVPQLRQRRSLRSAPGILPSRSTTVGPAQSQQSVSAL